MLRLVEPQDFPCICTIRADRTLQHMLMANPDADAKADPVLDAQEWVERRQRAGLFRVIARSLEPGIGFAQISDIHHKNRFGWMGIALLPAARGQGVGHLALLELEALAVKVMGLRKLLLQVRSDNTAAIALYNRAGWQQAGIFKAHYDDGETLHDVFIFEKILGSQ
jgi:RimJ/RimL family protein N-acetyltransferase